MADLDTNSTFGNSIMCVGTLSPEPRAIQFAEQVSKALGFDLVILGTSCRDPE